MADFESRWSAHRETFATKVQQRLGFRRPTDDSLKEAARLFYDLGRVDATLAHAAATLRQPKTDPLNAARVAASQSRDEAVKAMSSLAEQTYYLFKLGADAKQAGVGFARAVSIGGAFEEGLSALEFDAERREDPGYIGWVSEMSTVARRQKMRIAT